MSIAVKCTYHLNNNTTTYQLQYYSESQLEVSTTPTNVNVVRPSTTDICLIYYHIMWAIRCLYGVSGIVIRRHFIIATVLLLVVIFE